MILVLLKALCILQCVQYVVNDILNKGSAWRDRVNMIESYVDESVDPCSDFYQYACGRWSQRHHDLENGDVLGLMGVQINKQIRDLLRIQAEDTEENSAMLKARTFYHSCLSTANTDLQKFLDSFDPLSARNTVGSISNEIPPKFDWIDVVGQMRKYGINVLIEQTILPHWDDTKQNCIYLDKPSSPSLNNKFYIDESLKPYLDVYQSSIAELFGMLNYNETEAAAIAVDIVALERTLAQIVGTEEDASTDAAEVFLGYLVEYTPKIDWIKYFSIIMGKKLELHQTIILVNSAYFLELADIVANTSLDVLQNYFQYAMLSSLDDLKSFGIEDCTNILRNSFNEALSQRYVDKFYNSDRTLEVLKITENLKSALQNNINNSDWLDIEAKRAAKTKLYSTLTNIALTNTNSKTYDDSIYKNLRMHPLDFHKNYWNIVKYKSQQNQELLFVKNNRFNHNKGQAEANAFYIKTQNLVVIPAGILQPPVYHEDYPIAYKYGVLGTIIGHEISHGFDFNGKDYDAEGNMHPWWDDRTLEEFDKRVQCLISQYNNYTIERLAPLVNGVNTISENIADNVGLLLSYSAYIKSQDIEGDAKDFDISHKKLFFLSFAQFFCSQNQYNVSMAAKLFSEHSMDRFRVIGVLSNMNEFAEAFNCPQGSQMNPEEKCRVW